MKLDLNFSITDLKGNEITNSKASDLAANVLAGKTKHLTNLKAYRIAVDLSQNGFTEVDRVDLDLMQKELNESELLPNLITAQIHEAIEKAKKKTEQKKDEKKV